MGQKPSEIEREIAQQREELAGHVHELEAKIDEVTDWRTYVRQRPLAMTAGAFGAGLMLAFLFVKSR
jgi:hypothetical protein